MSVRVYLRGALKLIRVDSLRGVHTVDFLVIRLICVMQETFNLLLIADMSPLKGLHK